MADFWKYPKDICDVSVDWSGQQILPLGATAITSLSTLIKDSGGVSHGELNDGQGSDGLVTYLQFSGGVVGEVYTVLLRPTFDNGTARDKYCTLEIRNPRSNITSNVKKYPNERYYIPIKWDGRFPRAATGLGAIAVKAYNALDVDQSLSYISDAFALGDDAHGYFSIAQVYGGTGGDLRLLEFAQTFSNGRLFHEYVMLEVLTPPA